MVKKKVANLKFNKGDYVVYPSYGPGKILAIKKEIINGKRIQILIISINEKVVLRVPVEKIKSLGLRKLSTTNRLNDAITILKSKSKKKRKTMWSRRAQEYEAKIFSGDPVKIAEVVRDLFRKSSQAEQSYSERQMFQVAIERLAREVAAVEKTDYFQSTEKIENILNKK